MGVLSNKVAAGRSATRGDRRAQEGACILFVVPRDDLFAEAVRRHFADAGWSVLLTSEAHEAREVVVNRRICLVLLDLSIPDAQRLLDHLKLTPATNAIPVIGLFPRQCKPEEAPELRIEADVEFVEPFQLRPLLAAVERQVARFDERASRAEREVRLLLPSVQAGVDRAAEIATSLLSRCDLDETERTSLLAAFREAVGNAVQHGNRRDASKSVHVLYRHAPDRVTFVVRDEGQGFNFLPYLDQAKSKDAVRAARDRHRQGGQGGLGILMIARCADRVAYNEKGNVVSFTKFLGATQWPGP